MADKLCALEPISRHDIGQNSYRIKQVLEVMGGLRTHLASMNPYLSAGESDIEALRVRSQALAVCMSDTVEYWSCHSIL